MIRDRITHFDLTTLHYIIFIAHIDLTTVYRVVKANTVGSIHRLVL